MLEYSLELPYGRQALVWVTTETACYRIMSISSNYISFWQPFYEKVCFSGHVVNVLLNYHGPLLLVKLIIKVSKLSGKSPVDTYEFLKTHRKFIQDLLKDQNLSARIRKEYNILQSNQPLWDLTWDEHLASAEKKPEKFGKMNIMSFFRPRTSNENSNESLNSSSSSSFAKRSSSTLDETSSLLSISEDESAIYIESSYEFGDEMEKSAESGTIQNYIASSFTSARFLEWKLPKSESLKGSFYNCPLCKVTFKTEEIDSISAFSIHLKAHRADCDLKDSTSRNEEYSVNDFESRFNYFRNDLKDFVNSKSSYVNIPLTFDKNIIESSPQLIYRPFKQCALLEYEESSSSSFISSTALNPIKALKFNPNVISSVSPMSVKPVVSNSVTNYSVTPVPAASSTITGTITVPPKKPRAKKAPASKATATGLPSASTTTPLTAASVTSQASAVSRTVIASVSEAVLQHPPVNSIPLQIPIRTSPISNTQLGPVSVATPVKANIVAAPSPSVFQTQTSIPNSPTPIQYQIPTSNISPQSASLTSVSESVTSTKNNQTPSQYLSSTSKTDPRNNLIVIDSEYDESKHPSPGIKRSFSTVAVPTPIEPLPLDSLNIPPTPSIIDMKASYSMDGKQFGCVHYKVNCKFYTGCCNRWFPCRFCHDENSDHKMNRHETRFCLCMFCGTPQNAVGRCSNLKCRSVMAHYFCDKCKFWDNDPNKLIYHCDKCGICRTGLKSNYEHCDKCGKCIAKSAFSIHQCEMNAIKTISVTTPVNNTVNPVNTISMAQFSTTNQHQPTVKSNNLKLVLNIPSTDQQLEKRPKLDAPLQLNSNISQASIAPEHKTSVDHIQSNGPNIDQLVRRKCWNCSNVLPDNFDGSLESKYCTHCSAIVE